MRKSFIDRNKKYLRVDYNKPVFINVWQKPDGEFYVKITKHSVVNNWFISSNLGYVNSYGHKLIDSIKQYIDVPYIEND